MAERRKDSKGRVLKENEAQRGDGSFKGEALVTPDRYGIILRTDIEDKGLYWRHLVFHEISHIFCSTHELKDGNSFYKRYCADDTGDSVLNGIVCGGYAIWREFVADFLAILVDVDMPDPTLRGSSKEIKHELEAIAKGEPFIKTRIKTVWRIVAEDAQVHSLPGRLRKNCGIRLQNWSEGIVISRWRMIC